MILIPVISVLELLAIVFSVLFMHYSAKHRNHQLSVGWYICGFLFGFWTLITFLVKRRDFPGPDAKICYRCSEKYPENEQTCAKCLIELPEINTEEKAKEKKRSKTYGTLLIITLIVLTVSCIAMGVLIGKDVYETLSDPGLDYIERISVNNVYYDKKGKSYDDAQNVVLYDKKGRVYSFTVEEVVNEEDEFFNYNEYYYVREDGEKYFSYDCYVTEDGWFYCDKGGLLELVEEDTASMSEEELDEYYDNLLESEDEYKYYDYAYKDKNGTIYYSADEASWNEKGELITSENDVVK